MHRFLKTLLLWLLLAALPFQGVAAAMKTACGQVALNGSTGTTISLQSHHHHDETMDRAHAAVADHSTPIKSSPDNSADAKHTHPACSACASCCVGAGAPPLASDSMSSCSDSLPAVTSSQPLLASVVLGALERPPKRITA